MKQLRPVWSFLLVLLLASPGCSSRRGQPDRTDLSVEEEVFDFGLPPDVDLTPHLDPDAACIAVAATAQTELLPVDIIWVIDNSSSMQVAIGEVQRGLNQFATLIDSRNIDYKIIMVSLRSATNPVGGRYGVCIPPPLSGNSSCGNGPRFFHASTNILSTQPLEQFLGTLGQTAGYRPGDSRGGEPWRQELRANATKTIVVVSDDNSRLGAVRFETFPGGQNPFNSTTLPPGILDPSWGGLFTGYTFHGLYGWGSPVDPDAQCTYPDMTLAASSGRAYTDLVMRTGGTRAQICDGASAWGPFFDAVAQAVTRTTRVSCEIAIPTPDGGAIDPMLVNVSIDSAASSATVGKVANQAACGMGGGWYYDDDISPTKVILCPTSCDQANQLIAMSGGEVKLHFGCATIIF